MLQVAQRFAKALEGVECVLAGGGSEQLAVLVHEVQSPAAAHAITTELQNARQEPFALRQHRVKIATRVGFTCIDSGLQRAEDALREADVALSVAKRQQSQLTVAYTPGMGGAAVSLVSLEADLHIALERNEFRLLFQPIVDLRGQRVVGAEALLRWRHPVEGLLTPNDFLPIAEEAGVIVPVTRRSEEHTSELQSPCNLVCRLLLEKKKDRLRSRMRPNEYSRLRRTIGGARRAGTASARGLGNLARRQCDDADVVGLVMLPHVPCRA